MFNEVTDFILHFYKYMFKVIQFRAGAPDKVFKFVTDGYKLIQRDGVNLRDYSEEEICSTSDDTYFACADEGDILFAQRLPSKVHHRLMLPYGKDGLIKYNKFVPKDSDFYKGLTNATGIYYPLVDSLTTKEFSEWIDHNYNREQFVAKVQMGSGSRGVFVINAHRQPQPGARDQYLAWEPWMTEEIIKFAEQANCKILIEELAYTDLTKQKKYNCNFIIRNGKLVLYKWNVPENDSTNYDHAVFVRNEFTDNYMKKLTDYLVSYGVENIIAGIDGYTDYKDFVSAIELNWRYENSFFEFEAFNIDFMDAYLYPENYSMDMIPFGEYPFVRYWRCAMFKLTNGGSLNE